MTALDQLVIRRAQEQVSSRSRAWRRSDRDEHLVVLSPPACEVCGEPARAPTARTRVDLCAGCVRKGFRSRRCGCGRPMRTFDFGKHECSACRRERVAVEAA